MSDDLYSILGVSRTASQEDIRKAYRKLAKENHPDLNPGDAAAEERFKKVAAAFDILGDEDKRGRYDRGEIDASGQERAPEGGYRHYAEGRSGRTYQSRAGYADFADMGDIFSDLFGGGFRAAQGEPLKMRGQDVRYHLSIDFLEAVNGAKKRVTMPDGKTLDITVPAGLRDGQILRLKGKGLPGLGGGPAGDALIEVSVKPHPTFRRDGFDIRADLPISLAEAVLGGKVTVPTISGPVTMTIPKGSNTGKTLRLKGKGVARPKGQGRGDHYVTLKVVLPEPPDPELEAFVEKWTKTHAYSVR